MILHAFVDAIYDDISKRFAASALNIIDALQVLNLDICTSNICFMYVWREVKSARIRSFSGPNAGK